MRDNHRLQTAVDSLMLQAASYPGAFSGVTFEQPLYVEGITGILPSDIPDAAHFTSSDGTYCMRIAQLLDSQLIQIEPFASEGVTIPIGPNQTMSGQEVTILLKNLDEVRVLFDSGEVEVGPTAFGAIARWIHLNRFSPFSVGKPSVGKVLELDEQRTLIVAESLAMVYSPYAMLVNLLTEAQLRDILSEGEGDPFVERILPGSTPSISLQGSTEDAGEIAACVQYHQNIDPQLKIDSYTILANISFEHALVLVLTSGEQVLLEDFCVDITDAFVRLVDFDPDRDKCDMYDLSTASIKELNSIFDRLKLEPHEE